MGVSKKVMKSPYAGVIIPPTPQFIPNGCVWLLDAIENFGSSTIDSWNGKELQARKLPPLPDNFDDGFKILSCAGIPDKTEGINLPKSITREAFQDECAAKARYIEAVKSTREYLHSKEVPATIITDNGYQIDIPVHVWAAPGAEEVFRSGKARFEHSAGVGKQDNETPEGNVFLSEQKLQQVIEGRRRKAASHVLIKGLSYIPLYMNFMARVAVGMGLSEVNMPKQQDIKYWIIDHWQEDQLGELSERDAEKMATFLRPPERKSSGKRKEGKNK